MAKSPLVLGIESSCDDMAAAVLESGTRVLSSVVHGQDDVHRPYGGVVPELASRDHVRAVTRVVETALAKAGVTSDQLSGVAVTAGPGLVGSLLVGVSFAKALAYRLSIPVVGVHHLIGHLMAAELAAPALTRPYIGLVVSGGHTALYRIDEEGPPKILGETLDDAVGEAFDKTAKLLGLPYPGGPAISAVAEVGDPAAVAFPRPMLKKEGLSFSYSGLKTAVAIEVQRRGGLEAMSEADVADVAASFQAAATDVLVARARKALRAEALTQVAVVGGVAANRRLREEMNLEGARSGFDAIFPPLDLCTDNAVMIAAAGARLLETGQADGLDLNAFSRVPLGSEPWRSEATASAKAVAQGSRTIGRTIDRTRGR